MSAEFHAIAAAEDWGICECFRHRQVGGSTGCQHDLAVFLGSWLISPLWKCLFQSYQVFHQYEQVLPQFSGQALAHL